MIPGIFMLVYFVLMLVVGTPMAFCIGIVALMVPALFGPAAGITFTQVADWFVTGCTGSNTGLTIVLFMVAGDVMSQGKLTERIFNIFAYFLGKKRGFMPILSIITCMFYGAVSGSSPATVAAVGVLCYPMLVELGYPKVFSATILVAAGCLGGCIPPSTGLTAINALTGGLDLVALFKVAAILGVSAGLMVCVYSYIYCIRHGNGNQEKINAWVDNLRTEGFGQVFFNSVWAIVTPVLILGSIFSGIADTVQAAAISLIYGIFVSVFIYKSIQWNDLPRIMMTSIMNAGPVLVMVAFATVFSNSLGAIGVTKALENFVVTAGWTGSTLMVGVLFFMLIGGTIGAGSSVGLLTPLVYPLMIASGADPFLGCASMTLMQCVGGCTPPIGMAMFAMVGISGIDVKKLGKALIPCVILMFLVAVVFANLPSGLFAGLIGDAYVPIP